MWTIRETADGRWELVRSDGEGATMVLTVVGTHDTYPEAVGALAVTLTAERVAQLDDGATSADGLLTETWSDTGGICFSEPTGDGRDFTNCVWTARDPSVSLMPLMFHDETDFGHFGARLAGFIETISTDGGTPRASGRFYDSEIGRQARDTLLGGRFFGVSVDPGACDIEWQCTEWDEEDGWCIKEDMIFLAYQIIGLTMTPFPGFERAAIALGTTEAVTPVPAGTPAASAVTQTAGQLAMADPVTDHEFQDAAETGFCDFPIEEDGDTVQRICGVMAEMHDTSAADDGGDSAASVRAAATATVLSIPLSPPRSWFEIPEPTLDMPNELAMQHYGMPVSELLVEQPDGGYAVPLVIASNGQVYGNVARWGQCHVGYPGQCVTPPESQAAYAHFNVGAIPCEDGSTVAAGTLTVGCEHAPLRGLSASEARDHYAHSGMGFANVRATTGAFGPWACGVLRPDVTETQVRILRSLSLSGDWRRIGAGLEMIAGLAVNVPGFPIARESILASGMELVASGRTGGSTADGVPQALVAAGIVHRCRDCAKRDAEAARKGGVATVTLSDDDRRILRSIDSRLGNLERRTMHLRGPAAQSAMSRIRGGVVTEA